ncbi:hypothetical protein K3X13_08780 [Aliiroseovarius crassostreae]|uniref:Uncharacterized protein n=1 Tax=Aliiroseovarius crassostreae TaxID=154981 RepID=A0A9Q9HCP4_9RHOB|nr:hypothetical protein [Aliiroseovarius crassostreae]UWP88036.1 hypothetical protein K3J57_08835 [Aliiroseovarius crassostreae]UWP91190.1 hypothetical protein K3X13_08780 [Aliiroseovarius crassostreae]UWP94375.1 hypothetical protein K3X48_08955 [Aliiroseovarius crassostreae]UWP97501.1 hypothetical protein K3X53_08785 [Aliiroseovarius crassostreae]UWQ00656.1 hypothetical protein K3X44_08900 [Aliiroseovarius crassostreae]
MTPDEIQSYFTNKNGAYAFARWGRPIVPVVFGVEEETLQVVKGAVEAVVALAGHKMAETDPELGANLMLFFFRDWDELLGVPNLEKMVPDLEPLVARLKGAGASQYRAFRFDDQGAIQACFVFVCMAGEMGQQPAETIALTQAVQAVILWGENAFATRSPLAVMPETGQVILRPEVAGIIAASYDPVMPVAQTDASHALRLYARLQATPAAPAAAGDDTRH